VRRSILGGYARQIKSFLVLLVVFLAVAIYFDLHLLGLARNAILDETGERLGVEADLMRAEIERDQMLRGLATPPGTTPYIPPTYLDRMARLRGLERLDILGPEGRVVSSSSPDQVGREDSFLLQGDGRNLRRLMAGATVVAPLDRPAAARHATLAAYRPIRDRSSRATTGFLRVEREVPVLAAVDFNLMTIGAVQAGGLCFVLALVVLFARWLLRPYHSLQRAALEAAGPLPDAQEGTSDDAEALVGAFRGVIDKLRAQEAELLGLKSRAAQTGGTPVSGDRLISGMASAALVFGADGRLVTLNAAAETLLGIEARSRAAGHLETVLAPHPELVRRIRDAIASGEGRTREVLTLRGRDGRTCHLGAMISPIRGGEGGQTGDGAVGGVVCLLTDLTEIRSLRERARLKESLAAIGEMSAGIAHEFRNSLAVIQGYARLAVLSAGKASSTEAHGSAIRREVGRLQAVVNDFLRFARPQSPEYQEVDLGALVADLAAAFRADPRHERIRLDVEGDLPRLVADETLLRQALQNLLRNAAESFAEGAGSGGSADPVIVLRGIGPAGNRGLARIEVADNGPGIPADRLPHIFTPFYSTKEGGTGLGLALVQKVAALHDGQVEAESVPGRGTRIALLLPEHPGVPEAGDLVA
jgi:signal transduction histidine kinase